MSIVLKEGLEMKNYKIVKVGVAWKREFKNKKEGIKISIDKEIFIAYKNLRRKTDKDPDFVVVKFVDEEKKN